MDVMHWYRYDEEEQRWVDVFDPDEIAQIEAEAGVSR